ncbi:MAG TPA: methyltransferase [Pyrinomonadaceae bacterium]|nr:methyltransferase [Pyrinomonadaceae bacterium]
MSKAVPQNNLETPPEVALLQLGTGYWISQSIYVAARLGVADLLKDGPAGIEDLARATGTQPAPLFRLMRVLASVGVFAEEGERRYKLTPLSEQMVTGPKSMRPMLIHLGEAPSWRAWGELLHGVETGETAFQHANGAEVFPFYATHPESAEPFNEAMTAYSNVVTEAVINAYDFSPFRKIVDVGGGHGLLLTSILKAAPEASGVIFDLPPVVEGARARVEAEGLAERCEVSGGDFFESVPEGGDAYVLKTIIHDWDEERALSILRNIHRAMKDEGKLLLIETVIEDGDGPSFSKLSDLHMMIMTGGQERTEAEYATLYERAGFRLTRIVRTESLMGVVEGVKIK